MGGASDPLDSQMRDVSPNRWGEPRP